MVLAPVSEVRADEDALCSQSPSLAAVTQAQVGGVGKRKRHSLWCDRLQRWLRPRGQGAVVAGSGDGGSKSQL